MRALLETGFRARRGIELGTMTRDPDAAARHIATVLAIPYIDVEAIRAPPVHVALDCVRGAGADDHAARCSSGWAATCVAINLEPDGRFPRAPEPVPENLGELEALVRRVGADIGFAVDPDVDRLALVVEEGQAIGEDYTLALAAQARAAAPRRVRW